ncbi:Uncharacterized protein APZ42_014686 [Daphnia magna]|uniref:Uncharacterized protein n=1 Tax=Daphnia magna TaxID=35525 RepID=A0A162PNW3_9CRUS|nr:Uncharacterized protein APZ42_014686 [Daphnia magna]
MKSRKTRQSNDWLLASINNSSLAIGVKLPLKIAVMRRYLYFVRTEVNTSTKDMFKIVLSELKQIWKRASIPIKPDHKCIEQLMRIHKEWSKVKAIGVSKRNNPNSQKKKSEFVTNMNTLCDLSPPNVKELMIASRESFWEEDYNFFCGQRKFPQIGAMGAIDGKKRTRDRKRNQRWKSYTTRSSTTLSDLSEEEIDVSYYDNSDIDCSCTSRSTPRLDSIAIEISRKNLTKATRQVADSRNLSIRDDLAVQAAFTIRCNR